MAILFGSFLEKYYICPRKENKSIQMSRSYFTYFFYYFYFSPKVRQDFCMM
jgi:hypothetical protein